MSEALSYAPTEADEPASETAPREGAAPESSEAAFQAPLGRLSLVSSEAPRRSSRPLIVLLIVVAVVAAGIKLAPALLTGEEAAPKGLQSVPLGIALTTGDGRTFELVTTTTASIIGVGPGKEQTDRTVVKGNWRVLSSNPNTALVSFTPTTYAYAVNGGKTVTLRNPDLGLRTTLYKSKAPPENDMATDVGDWTLGQTLVVRPPMEEAFVPYAIKSALPGQSWEIPQTIEEPVFGQKVRPIFRYTLSSERPARDRRTITGSLSFPLAFVLSPQATAKAFDWVEDPGLANIVQARVVGSLDYDAEYEVDAKTGAVLEARGNYNIIVRVKLDRVDVPAMTFTAGVGFEYRSPKAIKPAKTA